VDGQVVKLIDLEGRQDAAIMLEESDLPAAVTDPDVQFCGDPEGPIGVLPGREEGPERGAVRTYPRIFWM
jgi:hypothetical protein